MRERKRERARESTGPSVINGAHDREREEGEETDISVTLTHRVTISLPKTAFKQLDVCRRERREGGREREGERNSERNLGGV